ncbi:MAG: GNAT family N-acetyltransferase [Phycisphaeraceae bacterium]|nr:GNAT family N-acetyltransferase [Phycisphaeraceae bacterium]
MHYLTPRLEVRDIQDADWEAMHRVRGDPLVSRYMDFKPATAAETRAWVEECAEHNRARPRFAHLGAIVLRQTGEIIGHIGVGHPDSHLRDIGDRDFGYALRRDCWGRGLMPEAIGGLLCFCFRELKVNSVFAQCAKGNTASARAMAKAGMVFVRELQASAESHEPSRVYIAGAETWEQGQDVIIIAKQDGL